MNKCKIRNFVIEVGSENEKWLYAGPNLPNRLGRLKPRASSRTRKTLFREIDHPHVYLRRDKSDR